jgi:hypothetical protein
MQIHWGWAVVGVAVGYFLLPKVWPHTAASNVARSAGGRG